MRAELPLPSPNHLQPIFPTVIPEPGSREIKGRGASVGTHSSAVVRQSAAKQRAAFKEKEWGFAEHGADGLASAQDEGRYSGYNDAITQISPCCF